MTFQFKHSIIASLLLVTLPQIGLFAAERPDGLHIDPIGHGPFYYDTAEGMDIKVSVLARGLNHPWSMTWLPDDSILVTEKNSGQIRRLVDDTLLSEPILGVPDNVVVSRYKGLLDITLHPDFASQPWVYMSYNKDLGSTEAIAIARGHWDGSNIQDTEDIFVGEEGTTNGARMTFGKDGMLYLGVYVTTDDSTSFETGSQKGKILRLKPDGQIPDDNPFYHREGFLPEIFSYGHRTPTGLTIHPETGDIWMAEMGPNGGDEVNLVQAGNNYGWPLVSFGNAYEGGSHSNNFQMDGTQNPAAFWVPGISISGMAFYSGKDFPNWQGDLFVGAMQEGQIPGTGHLQRIKFNDQMEEISRERLLPNLRQRVRDVKQGPDGKLYLLTDQDDGLLLRIEPVR